MRNQTSRMVTLVIALAFMCSCMFAQLSYADEGSGEVVFGDAPAAGSSVDAGAGSVSSDVEAPHASVALEADEVDQDGTEALEAYIDRTFEQAAAPVMRRAMSIVKAGAASTAGTKAYAQLSDYEKAIYDVVAPYFAQVAAGTLTNTQFPIPFDTLIEKGVMKERYSAEDLGVEKVLDSSGTAATTEALKALSNIAFAGLDNINHALIQDFVYESYWYDKTRGLNAGYANYGWIKDSGVEYLTLKGYNLTYSFYVTSDCSATGAIKTYETKDLSSIPTAAENARKVVADNSSKNDVRKLDAYRAYICEVNDYNDEAVSSEKAAVGYYGDPWQLVFVFDGDNTTNVVCEGYSKAFKRLCELSIFNNKSVGSNVTSGVYHYTDKEKAEAHMWNTVSINGYNYLVDVTNCDSYGFDTEHNRGTSGSKLNDDGTLSPGTGLFMRGSEAVAHVADNSVIDPEKYEDGYAVVIPDQTAGTWSMKGKTMNYYYEKASASVLPAETLVLAKWDCPLGEAADQALDVEAEIAAIGEPETFTSDVKTAIETARTNYDALTEAQKSLVSNVSALEAAEAAKAADEAATAALIIKDLEWGKTAQKGDDGTYAYAAGRAGEVAWTCTEPTYDQFEISVFRSDDTLVGSASADFSQVEAAADDTSGGSGGEPASPASESPARTVYSYYLPQANFTLDSGTYYFTVQPKGASSDSTASLMPKSATWTYSAPVATLAAPTGIALEGTSLKWTQPASTEANAESIDKFTYWVYRSPVELTSVELARATFGESGLPQASHSGEDATFELVIGADYPVAIAEGDGAKTCTVDLAKFICTFASREIITVKEGYYYAAVRAVSDDITSCKSSASSTLAPGINGTELALAA